jgi:hypothetical protein
LQGALEGLRMWQAHAVMQLLLPMGGPHNHVTLRNHALAVGASIQADSRPLPTHRDVEREAELGIDVGYVRQIKGRGSSSMAIVAAAVGAVGKPPRIWASAQTRAKPLHDDMAKFLADSGYVIERIARGRPRRDLYADTDDPA